jgi:hypothetical protein
VVGGHPLVTNKVADGSRHESVGQALVVRERQRPRAVGDVGDEPTHRGGRDRELEASTPSQLVRRARRRGRPVLHQADQPPSTTTLEPVT